MGRRLAEIGPSEAVARWLSKYGPIQTRLAYAAELCYPLRWLKGKGVNMSPDELTKDNLLCVFKSDPTDVSTKSGDTPTFSTST